MAVIRMTVQASDARALRRLTRRVHTKFGLDPTKCADLELTYRVSDVELAAAMLVDLKYACGKDYFQGWTQPWRRKRQPKNGENDAR